MTAAEFTELLAKLIATANDDGLSYEAIMAELRETATALTPAASLSARSLAPWVPPPVLRSKPAPVPRLHQFLELLRRSALIGMAAFRSNDVLLGEALSQAQQKPCGFQRHLTIYIAKPVCLA